MAARDPVALQKELGTPAPAGTPQGVPVPGSERPGRSAVYRNLRFRDRPLLTTYDPDVRSIHDLFEVSARKRPNKRCFGTRKWNPATQDWAGVYEWSTYGEVAEQRKLFGAGIVEIHKRINYPKDKFGVGIWSQNRPEWQIAGTFCRSLSPCQAS